MRIPFNEGELVTSSDFAFFENRQVKAGVFTLQKPLNDVGSTEANTEFLTRHARLGNHHLSLANAKLVTDVNFRFE